jgi:hypothetical protein
MLTVIRGVVTAPSRVDGPKEEPNGDIASMATTRTVKVPSAAMESVGRMAEADRARVTRCSRRPDGPFNPSVAMFEILVIAVRLGGRFTAK